MNPVLANIAQRFASNQKILQIKPLGNGLINDTYWVQTQGDDFVLQKINAHVFPFPEKTLDNLLQLQHHLKNLPDWAIRLKLPEILQTTEQQYSLRDGENNVWRALEFISPSESRETLSNPTEAAQIGKALGHFHSLFSDLDTGLLFDTLPGFHVTPSYFQAYLDASAQSLAVVEDDDCHRCQDFIRQHQTRINILESASQQGLLKTRVIHGDPKLNNFLFACDSDVIISLIDLDTVKPGLIHYDIADCLRSCCHIPDNNRFDLQLAEVILRHYILEAGKMMTEADYDYLYDAIWLIPFELGLRFFTDYLQGNRYFKISEPRENLKRAIAQFELCSDIEQQKPKLFNMVEQLKSCSTAIKTA